jgi:hypothetical protein
MVNRVVAPGTALEGARELAAEILAGSPTSVRISLEIMRETEGIADTIEAVNRDTDTIDNLLVTEDAQEGPPRSHRSARLTGATASVPLAVWPKPVAHKPINGSNRRQIVRAGFNSRPRLTAAHCSRPLAPRWFQSAWVVTILAVRALDLGVVTVALVVVVAGGVSAYVVYRHHQEATSLTSTNTGQCNAANDEARQMNGPFAFGSKKVDVLGDSYSVRHHAARPAAPGMGCPACLYV